MSSVAGEVHSEPILMALAEGCGYDDSQRVPHSASVAVSHSRCTLLTAHNCLIEHAVLQATLKGTTLPQIGF